MGITQFLEEIRGFAQAHNLKVNNASDFKKAVQLYKNSKAVIDEKLSIDIGLMLEISNSKLADPVLRQEILN